MNRGKWVPAGVALMGVLGLCGCQSNQKAKSAKNKEATAVSAQARPNDATYLTDVPLPSGFEILPEESEDRMRGQRRIYVRHCYAGREDSYRVRNFYMKYMPEAGWKTHSAGSVGGVHEMRFQKRRESCTITVSPQGRWGKTRIDIMILQDQ